MIKQWLRKFSSPPRSDVNEVQIGGDNGSGPVTHVPGWDALSAADASKHIPTRGDDMAFVEAIIVRHAEAGTLAPALGDLVDPLVDARIEENESAMRRHQQNAISTADLILDQGEEDLVRLGEQLKVSRAAFYENEMVYDRALQALIGDLPEPQPVMMPEPALRRASSPAVAVGSGIPKRRSRHRLISTSVQGASDASGPQPIDITSNGQDQQREMMPDPMPVSIVAACRYNTNK